MHTLLKRSEDDYQVGMWLENNEGRTSFMPILSVETLASALMVVNVLNGGDADFCNYPAFVDVHNIKVLD